MRRAWCIAPLLTLLGACSQDPFEFNFGLYDQHVATVPAHSTTVNGTADDVTDIMFADYATAKASAPIIVDITPADGSAVVETEVKFSYCEDNFGPPSGGPDAFSDLTYVSLSLEVQPDFTLSFVEINCMSHDTTEYSVATKLGEP